MRAKKLLVVITLLVIGFFVFGAEYFGVLGETILGHNYFGDTNTLVFKRADNNAWTWIGSLDANTNARYTDINYWNITWNKYSNTYISSHDTVGTDGKIGYGGSARGDDLGAYYPVIFRDGNDLHMWYAGYKGASNYVVTFHAKSTDGGIVWNKDNNNTEVTSLTDTVYSPGKGVIPRGNSGRGDQYHLFPGSVIKDGNTYKMWYWGYGTDSRYRIFLATSPDMLVWTKYDNTIPSASDVNTTNGRIALGTSGKDDDTGVYRPVVILENGLYRMWYTGYNSSSKYRIFYATSTDGLTWTKYDNNADGADGINTGQTTVQGIFGLGSAGTADQNRAYNASIIKRADGNYLMAYSMSDGSMRVGMAISTDGINWTKINNSVPTSSNYFGTYGRIPLGTSNNDTYNVYSPAMIEDNGYLKLFYNGTYGPSGHESIGNIYYAFTPIRKFADKNGLVTYLNFDNQLGLNVAPDKASGMAGYAINGAYFTPGLWDTNSLYLDGTNDYFYSPQSFNGSGTFSTDAGRYDVNVTTQGVQVASDWNLAKTYSINWWQKGNSNKAAGAYVIGTTGNRLAYFGDGKLYASLQGNGAGSLVSLGLSSEWNMITVTRNGTSTINVYVNGVFKTTITPAANADFLPTKYLFCNNNTSTDVLDVPIDQFSIFANTVLSDAQISALYNNGRGTYTPSPTPTNLYQFDEGSGTTVTDTGSSPKSGTWGAAPTWASAEVVTTSVAQEDVGTFCAWVKPSAINSNSVIAAAADTNTSRLYMAFIHIDASTRKVGVMHVYDQNDFVEGDANIILGSWNHICTQSTGTEYKIYLNGVLQNLTVRLGTNSGDWLSDLNNAVDNYTLGAVVTTSASRYFKGLIEEAKLYNRVLSQAEILSDYNSFLTAKFVSDSNSIVSDVTPREWQSIKINKNTLYDFGTQLEDYNSTSRFVSQLSSTNPLYDSTLVGLYHFNADYNDSAGTHGLATCSSCPTLTTGLWDTNSYTYNGSANSLVASGYTTLGTGNQPYTLSVWFNASVGETAGNLIHMSSNSNGSGWCLPPLSIVSSRITAVSWKAAVPNQVTATDSQSIIAGKWYHAVTTWDTSGLKLYVDGQLRATTTQADYSASGASNYLHFAGKYDGCAANQGYFSGKLEEAAVWSRALSATEIESLYKSQGGYFNQLSMLAHYKFNDTNGTNFYDSESGDNNLYCSGATCPTVSAGLWDTNAANFDGNDYLLPNNASQFGFNDESFSVSAWFKTDTNTRKGTIFSSFSCANEYYAVYTGASTDINGVYFSSRDSAGTAVYGGTMYSSLPNTWHHVVFVRDTVNNVIKLYFDGHDANTMTDSRSGDFTATSQKFAIGAEYTSGSSCTLLDSNFDGMIDDFAVWKRALTAAEVKDLFRKGSTQLDLNVYTCTDSACANKTSNQYLTKISNGVNVTLSGLDNTRYLGYDAFFKPRTEFSLNPAGFFSLGSFIGSFKANGILGDEYPTVLLLSIDGHDKNVARAFSSKQDGLLSFDFNVYDAENEELYATIRYSDNNLEGTGTAIVSDVNLRDGYCTDTNFSRTPTCTVNVNSLLAADGNYYFNITIEDIYSLGDFEVTPAKFVIDNTIPTASITYDSNWVRGASSFTLSCDDNFTGCATTYYRINLGAWTPYSSRIQIDFDGNYLVEYYSKDRVDNNSLTGAANILVGFDGSLSSFDDLNNVEAFFGSNERVVLVYDVNLAVVPRITVVDSLGVTQVASVLMSNISSTGVFGSNDLNTYYYAFDINGAYGWFDVNIENQRFENAFYYANAWNSKFYDTDSNSFPLSFDFNVTEPGATFRLFAPIDINLAFSPNANPNSIRVLDYNGTSFIEIPSQLYNYTANSLGLVSSGRLAFLSSFARGETKQFFVSYTVANSDKNYGTDANTVSSSTQVQLSNSLFSSTLNKLKGGILSNAYTKQGQSSDLNGSTTPQLGPRVQSGLNVYTMTSNSSPTVSNDSGEIVSKTVVNGTITSFNFDLNYLYYAKNPFIIVDSNFKYLVVSSLSSALVNDNYITLDSNKFSSYYDYNGVFRSTNLSKAGGSTTLSDLNAFAFVKRDDVTAFALISLANNSNKPLINSTIVSDNSSTSAFRKRIYSGTVAAQDYFYTKYALAFFNPTKGFSDLNNIILSLQNPLSYSVGSTAINDSNTPLVTTDANYSPFTPLDLNDAMDINCFAGFSDDSLITTVALNVLGPDVNINITEIFNSQNAFMDYIVADANLNAGDYNCSFTASDIVSNSVSSLVQFSASDKSAPIISSVASNPDSNAGVDPNVLVSVDANISEYTSLSFAKLFTRHYSNSAWSDWNETTMFCPQTGYTYFCDSNFIAAEGILQYYVNASDGTYDSNSSIRTLYSFTDYTWSIDSNSFGIVTITPLSTKGTAGSFTIQNTGDVDLSFKLASNWTDKTAIWYNENLENTSGYTFTVPSGSSLLVETKVKSKSSDRSDALAIVLDATLAASSPDSNSISATIISVSDGPFMLLEWGTRTTSVLKGNNATYTATLTNAGTEDATNVVLDWNYPSDWNLVLGTDPSTAFSLARLVSVSTSATFFIPSTASSGGKTVSIIASCCSDANKTQTLSTTTTIVSIDEGGTTPAQPTLGSSGGGGGGGSAGGLPFSDANQKDLFFQTNEFFELVRGQDDSFKIKFTNPLTTQLKNIQLSVSGIASHYLKLRDTVINLIEPNGKFETEIEIISPKYFSPGEYEILFNIKGDYNNSSGKIQSFVEQRTIKLLIHDTNEQQAKEYLLKIKEFADDLSNKSMKVDNLPDLLEESSNMFEKRDFDGVKDNYLEAKNLYDSAIEAMLKSRSVSGLVALASSGGLLTPGTDRLLLLAQLALARGDYALALERLREAELTYALETKGEFNLFIWVLGNLDRVFVMLVLFVLAVYLFYLGVSLLRINSGLRELNSENSLLLGLIASLQRKSFVENKMSLGEYYDSLGQFEKRISEVSEHIIELTTKKNNLFAFTSSVTRLGEEKKSLLELIRDTQKQYFNLGLIETRIYSARTGSLTKRLSEVEEQLVTNDLKKTIRINSKGINRVFWRMYYRIFK